MSSTKTSSNRVRHPSRVAESFANFVNLMGNVSSSHDHAFRQALFMAVAMFFLIIVLLVGYQVYFILQTFLKPLAWAALTGTILFPLKYFLTEGAKRWLQELRESQSSLFVALAVTPFKLLDQGFDAFGAKVLDFIWHHHLKVLAGFTIIVGYIFAQVFVWNHIDIVTWCFDILARLIRLFRSKVIWYLLIPYIIAVNSLWTPEHRRTLRLMAWPLWIWLGLHLSSLLGSLAPPILVIVAVVLCLGFMTEMKVVKGKIQKREPQTQLEPSPSTEELDETATNPPDLSFWKVLSSSVHHLVTDENSDVQDHHDTSHDDSDETHRAVQALRMFKVNEDRLGTRYMMLLFWTFIAVEAVTHYYVLPFLLVPVAYRIFRRSGQRSGTWEAVAEGLVNFRNNCKFWIMSRKDVVAPTALRGLLRLAKQGDRKMLILLEESIDEAVSLFLVLLMFLAIAFCAIVTTMQVQQETVHLAGLTSDFMNQTIVEHPELLQWLPEGAQVSETVQTAFDSVYLYGRNWISGTLREAITDKNETRVAQIEKDILSIADRIYNSYIQQNNSALKLHSSRRSSFSRNRSLSSHPWANVLFSEDEEKKRWQLNLWSRLNQSWHQAFEAMDWSNMSLYVKNNIDTLYQVFESVWNICKGNFSLIFSLVTTIFSIFIVYFSALMHFIFCGLVYIAALYYLLSSSKDRYSPLDAIAVISPHIAQAGHVAEIIEQTISDIFAASFKMAAFYGFYTWILLSAFGIYFKFIPSVLASMLAVCPLVPPFLLVIPAFCELWFLRGDYIPAVLMLISAWLPSMFVDIAIYGDVKNAHPYMFGLSVAGGLVTMGLEGAVFGPVMMCILMVCLQVYKRILEPTTSRASVSVGNLVSAANLALTSPDSTGAIDTPDTPGTERRVTFGESTERIIAVSSRKESVLSYPAALLKAAEAELEKSVSETAILEPRPESLSLSRRRERVSSFSLQQSTSTPKDDVPLTRPDFANSPI